MSIIRKVHSPALSANVFVTRCGQYGRVLKPKAWDDKQMLVAVKDNIVTNADPTTCASTILRTHQSPFSAEVITRLEHPRCRAAIMGKTNMDEFGMGSHSMNSFKGSVQNAGPFHRHSVGGSSGGSAVAVATNKCVAALGTDTGGSIRLPAAYTGVVGFKPSYGRVSRWGVIPYANSLDTVGVLASEARIAKTTFHKIDSFDSKDPTSLTDASRVRMEEHFKKYERQDFAKGVAAGEAQGIKTQREATPIFRNTKIGVPLEYNIAELDPGIREAWQRALQLFQDNGATIVPVSLPNTKHALSAYYVLAPAEAASNLSKYDGVRYGGRFSSNDGAGHVLYSHTRGFGFGDEVKRRILLGSYALSSGAIDNYFIKAQKVRRLVQRDFDRVFAISNPLRPAEQFDLSDMDESIKVADKFGPAQVDFIVCPTAPTTPPTRNAVSEQSSVVDTYMNDVFTVPASLAGLPAISIPFPIPHDRVMPGIPDFCGIQLIGQYFDDERVLLTAKELQRLSVPPATATAKPTKRPQLEPPDLVFRKHFARPKARRLESGRPTMGWMERLKMEKYTARYSQNRAAAKPQSAIGQSANGEPDNAQVAAFHKAFAVWEALESPSQHTTVESARVDLDEFFEVWDKRSTKKQEKGAVEQETLVKKEKSHKGGEDEQKLASLKKDPKQEIDQEPATRDDKKGEQGYYD